MSKYSGTDFAVFLVDGYDLLAAQTENVTMGEESLTQQTNGFGVGNVSHTPQGLSQGVLQAMGGFLDQALDALHTALGTVTGISRIVCAAIEGNTIGKLFMGFEGAYSQKYERLDQREGLTRANVTYLVSGKVEYGQIIQHHTQFTADWDTRTGGAGATDAPVDYTADVHQRVIPITSNTAANPSVVTTTVPHGLTTGQVILISGVASSSPTINGQRTVTVLSSTTFSVAVNVTVPGTGGSFVLASTVNGGTGYQQVSQFSGFTGFIGTLNDSPDDSVYASLITFDNVTGRDKQRKTVSGTVDRFLSFNGDVTGTGSITPFCGFCRN